MKKHLHLLILTLFIGQQPWTEVTAQERAPIRSPEFNPDGTITFRYDSHEASKVEISAEFLQENQAMMKSDTSGVWSVTLGPFTPDIYPYFFVVDGVNVADPANPDIFPNERFKRSLIDIPAGQPLIHDWQEVPHGEISYCYYTSSFLGLTRPLLVYTPPGYQENTDQQYPVLYLIHGMTDTEETWLKVGRVHLIMDNLIAQGKAKPMIVVMPYANPYPALKSKDKSIEADYLRTDLFIDEMMKEVIPFTEKNYSVLPDAAHRAIAGFSLGGRQTLAAGLSNPDQFSYVCAFAPAIWEREFEENFSNLYASPETLNDQLKLLWVSCGKADFLYESSTDFLAVLDQKNIQYEAMITEGGHTWMNVRNYLASVAQKLFQ